MDSKNMFEVETKSVQNQNLQQEKSNLDVALEVLGDIDHVEYTPEEEKKVLLKIDLHLMTFMIGSYLLQFLDKNALSNSSVFGLQDDLHLEGQQYSWAGSIFYFGYLIGQPIASRCFQWFSISKYVGACLVAWSIVLVCTAAAHNFAGLACIRFFLGVCEATVSPAWVILTSMWYKKTEQPIRVSIWYSGNAIGVIFGGLIAYGLGHIQSSIASWKWFYVIYGIITFFWGITIFFFLPESIASCKFLNEREKLVAIERIRENKTGIKNSTFKWEQCKEAFLDPQVWLLCLIEFVGCLPAGGIQNFGNLILESFGFTSFQTVLINMPSGVIQGFTLIASGLIVGMIPNSACHVQTIAMIPCIIGTALVHTLPNHPNSTRAGKLVAFWIQYSNTASDVGIFALMTRNISGFTKKTVSGAMVFVAYCVGMISAPQFFKSTQAPGYEEGFRMMIVTWVLLMILPQILKFYYDRENKKRDRLYGAELREIEEEEFHDLTDLQQRGFRYIT